MIKTRRVPHTPGFACAGLESTSSQMEQEDQLRALKMQKLRQDLQKGLDSGPSTVFDPQEIKRAAREKKSAKSAK
jgi:hypothetical protein